MMDASVSLVLPTWEPQLPPPPSLPVASSARPAGKPGEVDEDVLDQLIGQFGSPLCFLRELVQNAIDAGSREIDLWCTFEPCEDASASAAGADGSPAADLGVAIIRVTDWGEGMDRQIIETRLTRLFSSDKELDRTKIGKFGIGFVSVFAFSPDAVCIDTGRRGESWRVLFRPDRSYTCSYLTEPVEGTTVRLFKGMSHSEFIELERRVRRTLQKYCRHLEVTLRYQGELFSSALTSDALPCAVKVFTRFSPPSITPTGENFPEAFIIVGYTEDGSAGTGTFCNRGLTLLCRPSELPGISYLVDSPGLSSTQGRDSIIADEHYGLLMAIVQRLASGPLIEHLSQRLEQGLREQRPEAELAAYQRRLCALPRASLPETCVQRAVARSPHNDLYTLASCEDAARQNRLYLAATPSPLSAAVSQCSLGGVVLQDWQRELGAALARGEPPRLEQVFVLPLRLQAPTRPPLLLKDEVWQACVAALCAAAQALLVAAELPVGSVQAGHLGYAGSGAAAQPAVAQLLPFTVTRLHESLPNTSGGGPPCTWVLNVDHHTVQALLKLSEHESELGAYHLIKLCLLGGTALTPELDSRLLSLALELRCHSQHSTR